MSITATTGVSPGEETSHNYMTAPQQISPKAAVKIDMTQLYTGGGAGLSVTGSFGGTMSTVAPGGSPGSKRKFPPAPGFLSNEERHLNKLNTTAQITPGTLC